MSQLTLHSHDDKACSICRIPVRELRLVNGVLAYVHAQPRTLENNLHNGTLDHDAVVS